jgi:hypothetical protein
MPERLRTRAWVFALTRACSAAAFQDSYDTVLDPLLVKLLEAVETTANDEAHQEAIDARKNICSTNAFASAMTLDMSAAPQPLPNNQPFP